jgi:putative FmdB family regulatory protein
MPVYEYRCTSCHKHMEIEHRMSEKRTECPECGGPLERLISRTSFAFKGGGWYKDLYATPKPADMSGKSTGEGASGGGSDSGGSSSGSSSSSSEKSSAADKPASTDKPSSGGSSSGGAAAAS